MNSLISRLKLIGKDWYIDTEWRKTLETSSPPWTVIFIKEAESFQYSEFPKPWKDRKKGDYWLGLEVIFSDKLNLKVSYESRTED